MSTLRLVSVDPGTNLGLACLNVDLSRGVITPLDCLTADLNKLMSHYSPAEAEDFDYRLVRLRECRKVVQTYMAWGPEIVVHETAYVPQKNMGSISSYASLVENILTIRNAVFDFDKSVLLRSIDPTTIKYAVTGKKSPDKGEIKNALLTKSNLDLSMIDTTTLDQHAFDAIAIGYSYIVRHLF